MKKSDVQDTELSRRQFILSSTGTGFAALLLACGIKSGNAESTVNTNASAVDKKLLCSLTPQKTEGPYYIEGSSIRKNIREDSKGKNLLLKIQVVDVASCQPIQNAVVSIWHCNATGIYSGYESMNPDGGPGGFGGPPPNGMPPGANGNQNGMMPPPPNGQGNGMPPPPPRDGQRMGAPMGPPPNGEGGGFHEKPSSDKRFLRGVQITDSNGLAEFETVYPGWYAPRAVHIHLKVFLNDKETLTSQLFFPEELNDKIFTTVEPYKNRGANPNKNANDDIAGDDPPILTISETEDQITGTITIGVKSA